MHRQEWLFLSTLFLFLIPMVSFAQVGPFGIGNGAGDPTPAGPQPRVLLWLDGSNVQKSGSAVTKWVDKSGNGHDFVPDAAANRPTFQPTSGPAGTPCLSFDGVDDRLVCSNFEFPSSGYSIYFIIKSSDNKYGMFSYATASEPHEINIYNDNGFQQEMGSNLRASAIGNISTGSWNYGGIWWNNSSNQLWEYNRNNSAGGEGSSTFANGFNISTSGTAVIGDIQNSVNGGYVAGDAFHGQIAEIIVWEGVMNKAVGRMMRTYIYTKYGNADGNTSNWDKFQGHASGSAGEYYEPIGVGRDGGAHYESRLHGLVLRCPSAGGSSYMCAGQVPDAGNSAIISNAPGVQQQWKREWEISGDNGGINYEIGFDFGEGISNGQYPQNIANYVLLRKNGINGSYSEFTTIVSKAIVDDEVVFTVNKSKLASSNYYFTIGTKNASESSLTGESIQTWYAYQAGNWNDPLTWTLDGSAAPTYVNPNNEIPGTSDNVYIGSGRTVTVNIDGVNLGTGTFKVFGTLDVGNSAAPAFASIAGSGLIRCAGNGAASNFPTGNSTAFADPVNGGTAEFYGSGGFTQSTDLEVNKLKLNLTGAGTLTLAANLTHNGLFEVNSGTFTVNNTSNTVRTITSNARVLVESGGNIRVSAAANGLTKHKWYFYSDLINNGGTIRFTNRSTPGYAAYSNPETDNIVEAYFVSDSQNQELRANGSSYFSRIVIDKGVDATYTLSISAVNANNFRLLGPCDYGMGASDYISASGNKNSFAPINGTVEIKENVFIPLQTNVGNYNLNKTAQLWINGGEATKGPLGGSGGGTAIVNYGVIKISDGGRLNAYCNSGITTRQNGILQVDGGFLYANQLRTSVLGTENIGGIIINGGKIYVNGNNSGGTNGSYYAFSLTYPGNLFRMTGGELHVTGPTGRGLIFINSDPQNTNVSGGTVFVDVSDTDDHYKISSRAAFWNLTITRSSTSSTNRHVKIEGGSSGNGSEQASMADQDLTVRGNLNIIGSNSPTLDMGSSQPADLYLYGDLQIGNGGVYNHNKNTTHFVGSSNSSLTFGGTTTFPFYNIEVNKNFDDRKVKIQNAGPNPAMDIKGSIFLEKGYFDNDHKFVELKGNITNRTQFGEDGNYGYLRMNGTSGQQKIISDGGVFHKLLIDNPSGVVLQNGGVTVKTWLKLEAGSFFIGDYKLRMESTESNPILSTNQTDKFIVCSGNASAGGIEILNHSATQTLTYPFGVSTGSGQKYTPANIYINSGWVDDGYIRVTPVDTLLSTSDLNGTGDYLNYYWRVSSSDYDTEPKVTHRFKYDEADVRGTEANFKSGRVLSELPSFTRSIDNAPTSAHVNTGSNLIYYNGTDQAQGTTGNGTKLVNADYSAGNADRFTGSPEVFYSRSSVVPADWDVPGNWNKLSDCTGCSDVYDYHSTTSPASTTDYPERGDIAVIGFNVNNSAHKPHVYKAPTGGIQAAQVLFTPLQDSGGNRQPRAGSSGDLGILRPTLQISSTSDITKVRQISGEGELLLKGDIDLGVTDIGGFLAEDSSLIVVNTGNLSPLTLNFLPPSVPNLFLAYTNATISSDIHVRGNLEVAGLSRLYLNESIYGNIEIDGDLILDKYQSISSQAQVLFNKRGSLKTVTVHGDVKLFGDKANIGISMAAGPPIVPVPWEPDEVSPQLWFDAADGPTVHTSGTELTGWDNKGSGGLYGAVQTTSTKRPVYQSNGLNSLHTIHFDGVDDFLRIANNAALDINANDDFELFSVIKSDVSPSRAAVIAKGGVNSGDYMLYFYNPRYKFYMDGGAISMQAGTGVGTSANLGWARRQGNSAALYNTISGSASDNGVSGASTSGNSHDVTIGAMDDGYARFFDGDIAEIILVRHALTDDQRDKMEGYLAHKWGLEGDLPTGHPYKDDVPYVGGVGNKEAQLIVDGDIIQNYSSTNATNNGMVLYKITPPAFPNPGDTAYVKLVVTGSGTNEYKNINGLTPKLWKLKVDKGTDITSGFTFNTDIDIDGLANLQEKPVDIQNGQLKFNNSNIDLTLSSGGGDFTIPVTGGLELDDGDLSITGPETGLLLSGSLKMTGGNFTIGDTDGENNYIEYSPAGTPKITISGGNLTVGSQIRRGLSSLGGSLDYRQSGGNVVIGKYSAPATNRGMLEVLHAGRFDHTGGILTFVRGVNLGTTPSLWLTPANANVSGTSEIIIGNNNSPSGAAIQNFGINSSVALNKLTINSTNSPVVHLITNDLELNGDLTINSGAKLDCGIHNLTLHKDVTNDGDLSSVSGKVSLIHPGIGVIDGTGNFDLYNLERSGGSSGQTQVLEDLLVKNDFSNDGGEMSFGANTLTVKGDVTTDGTLQFSSASNGLIFSGTTEQFLKRSGAGTSQIDAMTVNNAKGVTIPNGDFHFVIDKNLRLEKGVFSLTGNLLEMADGSVFTPVNPFSETNMIVTGGAFTNFGVLLHVPANSTDNISVPLGINKYMPVELDFEQPGFSSGSTPSTYLLRLNIPENVLVTDPQNALGMYFTVDGTDVGNGLNMQMRFHYDQDYVHLTGTNTEADYIAARAYSNGPNDYINRFTAPGDVDETNNIITFSQNGDFLGDQTAVDGDYFAGVDAAIQQNITTYTTAHSGNVDAGGSLPGGTYTTTVPGGNAPAGARVNIVSNHFLTLNVDGINLYRTDISPNATVKIDATAYHRLGKVTGTGTIQLVGTGNLPSGDYNDFFGCFGGKLIYEGRNGDSFEILSNLKPVEKVDIIGSANSDITIADNDITVCENLTIDGPRVKAANSARLTVDGNLNITHGQFDFRQGETLIKGDLKTQGGTGSTGAQVVAGNTGKTTIEGDLILGGKSFGLGTIFRETHLEGNLSRTSGTVVQGTGGAKLVFDGSAPQTVTGNFTGTATIPFIEMNNDAGLTLNGNVDVSDTLKLTDGNIFTDSGSLIKLTEDGTDVDPKGGQANSFVDGPMQWVLLSSTSERTFPIGKNDRFRPLSLDNRSANRTWEAQYYDTIARVEPTIDNFMLPNPTNVPAIETVSIQEYWRVNHNGGSANAKVGLSWGNNSVVSPVPGDYDDLLVLGYNTVSDEWDSYGGTDFQSTGPNQGNFISQDLVPFSERFLTLGSSSELNPLPVTWLYFKGHTDGKTHTLTWATGSEKDNDYFELERSVDAQNWKAVAKITGAGHSTTMRTYKYVDHSAPFGRVYYRIKQVDFDAKEDYAPNIVSLERAFEAKTEKFDFLLYPNPSKNTPVRFRMSTISDAVAHVMISDLSGKRIREDYVQINGQGNSAPMVCNFEPGIYLVTVIVNNKICSKPLVITK